MIVTTIWEEKDIRPGVKPVHKGEIVAAFDAKWDPFKRQRSRGPEKFVLVNGSRVTTKPMTAKEMAGWLSN